MENHATDYSPFERYCLPTKNQKIDAGLLHLTTIEISNLNLLVCLSTWKPFRLSTKIM